MLMNSYFAVKVRRVIWSECCDKLSAVRVTVFVEEQHVPEALEIDGLDDKCLHVLAESATGEAVGTGRLSPNGHIGRMAVLEKWRRRGVGEMLLRELIAAAVERNHPEIELSAQTHAIGFYQRFGFDVVSEEYLDAGITHRTMRMPLLRRPLA
jgi:predicted GNAT family N-acyltransferase